MSKDYSQFASMLGNKEQMTFQTFNAIKLSGKVGRVQLEGGLEKKKDPEFSYTNMKAEKVNGMYPSTSIPAPITLIPLKLRSILEARSSDGKEVIIYSTEYNNGADDMVTITDKINNDKKYSMSVREARKQFVTRDGKSMLRQAHRLYCLYKGENGYEVVRFNISGSAVWEAPDAPTKEMSISDYLNTFPATEPAFLYEMKVGAVYRPPKSDKVEFYRPVFARGERITPEVEEIVLRELQSIHEYCKKLDEISPSTKMTDKEVSAVNTSEEVEITPAESIPVDEDESPF